MDISRRGRRSNKKRRDKEHPEKNMALVVDAILECCPVPLWEIMASQSEIFMGQNHAINFSPRIKHKTTTT